MFKKLKDKIAEEVKSSPQRIQQFTQSVTEKIQNATSEDSFFSIAEDDAPSSSPNLEPGFSNVPLSNYSTPNNSGRFRRSSNSSVASDMSFLPRYESATNLYHMQSDLDISASEMEDNASTSSQLGYLSKEQIYSAFQKAQMRYHKYRGRYTDIANHYKELERENAKMKSVLVETQDKALRRVAELREQCSLEQKAKAHLENALRVELDEKQYVIDTLRTKVNLLQTGTRNGDPANAELLVDVDESSGAAASEKPSTENLEILTKDLKDARLEIESLNQKLQETKANAIVFGSKEADLKRRISELEELGKQRAQETSQILERERENNLIIAQTKMELHTEIQNRDLEIENLKHDIETLKSDLEVYENKPKASSKMENLQSQNGKLIEKVEELTHKCNNYESELLKVGQLKIEIETLHKTVESYKTKITELEENGTDESPELEEIRKENASLQGTWEKLLDEKADLEKQMREQEVNFEQKMDSFREDTKQNLLGLENKIRDKFQEEFSIKEQTVRAEFQEKLEHVSRSGNNVKEVQLRLLEAEQEAKDLEERSRQLEIDLEKQKRSYKELETNHLELITENSQVRNDLAELQKTHSDMTSAAAKSDQQIGELKRQKSEVFATFKQEIVAVKEENRGLLDKITVLQNSNVTLQNENTTLCSDNSSDTLKVENANLGKENAMLQEKVSSLERNLADSVENSDEQKSHLQTENVRLQEENATLKDSEKQLQAEINKCSLLRDENAELRNEVSELKLNTDELIERNTALDEQVKRILNDHRQQLNGKADEIEILQRDLLEHEDRSIGECKTLQAQLEHAKQELEETRKTLETTKQTSDSHKAALAKKLKEQKTKFHNEIQGLNGDISNFKDKNRMIQACIDEYKQKLEEYEAVSLEKAARLQDLANENVALKTEVDELRKAADDAGAGLQQKTETMQGVQDDLDQLRVVHKEVEAKLDRSTEENDSLREKVSRLEEDSSRNVTEITASNEGLRHQLEQLGVTCKTVTAENDTLKAEVSKLREKESEHKIKITGLEVVEGRFKKMQEEKVKFLNEVSQLQKTVEDVSERNRDLQNEVTDLRGQTEVHQQLLQQNQEAKESNSRLLEEQSELKRRNNELSLDYRQVSMENEGLLMELAEIKLKHETLSDEKSKLAESSEKTEAERSELFSELQAYKTEVEKLKLGASNNRGPDLPDPETLCSENKTLKAQVAQLEERCEAREKQKKNLEMQLHELENQYTEISHERQLLQDEIQELKISPLNMSNHTNNSEKLDNLNIINTGKVFSLEKPSGNVQKLHEDHQREITHLNEKLVQYKSLDLTNRSSIQFYENELQKLRNKNEKLNRKLDETLVTLNHCTELSNSTEVEYLRNVLYNYMLGKEGLVLARVIAAVCKFDENQTEAILQREQQKQTLLGQLGFISQ